MQSEEDVVQKTSIKQTTSVTSHSSVSRIINLLIISFASPSPGALHGPSTTMDATCDDRTPREQILRDTRHTSTVSGRPSKESRQ